jgi:biopolymer transport protein ExbD
MALGRLPEDEAAADGGIFADINITPLTDIFLVLLIIFMVSSSIVVETASRAGVKVNLPQGTNKEIDPTAKTLVVSVLRSGEVLVQGKPVKEGDLGRLFESAAAKDSGTQVVLEADEGVTHGSVVRIMDLAKRSGLARLAIATRAAQ